jgi:hypothetical protein
MAFAKPLLLTSLFFLLSSLPIYARSNPDPDRLLREADGFAMLYNWPKASPLYAQAEALFARSGDQKGALSARLGRIRAQIDTAAVPKLDTEVEKDMRSTLVQGDAHLLLRCLTTKAAIDQEVNEASARELWERISDVAKRINDKRWQARAEAELGIITFLDGDVATVLARI